MLYLFAFASIANSLTLSNDSISESTFLKMAPKKRTKAIKLANMSEEERLRYIQHKAIMEEEVHRRKRQIIGTYASVNIHLCGSICANLFLSLKYCRFYKQQ